MKKYCSKDTVRGRSLLLFVCQAQSFGENNHVNPAGFYHSTKNVNPSILLFDICVWAMYKYTQMEEKHWNLVIAQPLGMMNLGRYSLALRQG